MVDLTGKLLVSLMWTGEMLKCFDINGASERHRDKFACVKVLLKSTCLLHPHC
jgi:hypothetical protein